MLILESNYWVKTITKNPKFTYLFQYGYEKQTTKTNARVSKTQGESI